MWQPYWGFVSNSDLLQMVLRRNSITFLTAQALDTKKQERFYAE
jgi:hypothetical protein